jgi:hypothetical protein
MYMRNIRNSQLSRLGYRVCAFGEIFCKVANDFANQKAPSRNQDNDVVGIRLLWNLDMVPNDSSKVRVTRRVYISIHT